MDSKIKTTVYQWLRLMDIEIDKAYLSQRLLSHPDFPSALSITSLLDDLGIENSVAQIDASQLEEVPTPFLAFVDGKDFLVVADVQNIEHSIKDFKSRWNGIVIFAEKPSAIIQSEEMKKADAFARDSRIRWIMMGSVFTFLSGVAFFELSITDTVLFLVALFGLVVSSSIVLRESGIETVVSNRLCGEGETTGCDAVLHTKASTLPLGIKLSDVGVSFFSGIILLSLVSCFTVMGFKNASQLIIEIACLASVPFTLFSIFYQWRIVKKWCASCLFVVASLWIMVIVQMPYEFAVKQIDLKNTLAALSIFILPGTAWLLIRNLLIRQHELMNSNIALQRIYRSPELFQTHLLSQEKIEIAPWSFDFRIGNADAACQIVVVNSHSCGPCAETFEILQKLVAKLNDQVGITIRFSVNNKDKYSLKTRAMRQMYQYAIKTENFLQSPEKIAQMLNFWYTVMDIEKFSERYPVLKVIDVENKMEQQRLWCQSVSIQSTPTIFINGYELRSPYSQADLLEFGSALVEIFSNAESRHEVYI